MRILLSVLLCTLTTLARRSYIFKKSTTQLFIFPWELNFSYRASCESSEREPETDESWWNNTFPPDSGLSKMSEEYHPRSDENHTEENLARRVKVAHNWNATEEMILDYIVPFVIPKGPKEIANVSFHTGAKPWLGNLFPRVAIKGKPTIQWSCNRSSYYTIFLTNLEGHHKDNITKLKNVTVYFDQRHHWLVVNIPNCRISHGEVLIKYLVPINEKTMKYYMYVILVYEQKRKLDIDHRWKKEVIPTYPTTTPFTTPYDEFGGIYKVPDSWRLGPDYNRTAYRIQEFVQKYDLGDPLAGNHFYVFDRDFKPFTPFEPPESTRRPITYLTFPTMDPYYWISQCPWFRIWTSFSKENRTI